MKKMEAVTVTRRAWLAHCSLLLASPYAAAALKGPVAAASKNAAASGPARILVLGDSLSAEYGLARGSGWVTLLERRLREHKLDAAVVNASISGETTAGGRTRLPALLAEHKPTHLLIELGGNDALRGLPLAMTRQNLDAMAGAGRAAGARVVMVGMQLPPNYGRQYGADFAALFAQVAKAHQAALVPFLLQGVADGPQAARLFQADRIHPTAEAQPRMLDNVWPVLSPLL
jgi:acyl-CoA thioesterase-1